MIAKLLQRKNYYNYKSICCPSCGEKTDIEAWNRIAVGTYGEHSPDIREAAKSKKVSFPYQCPKCYKGYSAYLLKFE